MVSTAPLWATVGGASQPDEDSCRCYCRARDFTRCVVMTMQAAHTARQNISLRLTKERCALFRLPTRNSYNL